MKEKLQIQIVNRLDTQSPRAKPDFSQLMINTMSSQMENDRSRRWESQPRSQARNMGQKLKFGNHCASVGPRKRELSYPRISVPHTTLFAKVILQNNPHFLSSLERQQESSAAGQPVLRKQQPKSSFRNSPRKLVGKILPIENQRSEWQRLKEKNNLNFQAMMQQSMNQANQINSGAFIMDRVFQENAKNALVQYLIQEVQQLGQRQNRMNARQSYLSSTENSKSSKEPKTNIEQHEIQIDQQKSTKLNDDLEQLASTQRKTEVVERLVTSKEDVDISPYLKEDSIPMVSKIKHTTEISEPKPRIFSRDDPDTIGLSPKTNGSLEPKSKLEKITASSKSHSVRELSQEKQDLQLSNQTKSQASNQTSGNQVVSSQCQTNKTPNAISNSRVMNFNFSNHVDSVIATKRTIKTMLIDNPVGEINDPSSSLIKNGEHIESQISHDQAILSPGLISQIKVRKHVLPTPKKLAETQQIQNQEPKVTIDKIFQPIKIQEEANHLKQQFMIQMLNNKSGLVPSAKRVSQITVNTSSHPITAQDGQRRFTHRRFTTTAQIQQRPAFVTGQLGPMTIGIGNSVEGPNNTARQIKNFYESLITSDVGKATPELTLRQKLNEDIQNLNQSNMTKGIQTSQFRSSLTQNHSMMAKTGLQTTANGLIQKFMSQRGAKNKTIEWPNEQTPRGGPDDRLKPQWKETLQKFYRKKNGVDSMMERQFNKTAASPTFRTDMMAEAKANAAIFTNVVIMGAKKKSSQLRHRKSVNYTVSDFTEDMSLDSSILTPISGIQILKANAKKSEAMDESISNIMNHIQGSHISALYNSKELKAEEISLNHFRPYSVIQDYKDGDCQGKSSYSQCYKFKVLGDQNDLIGIESTGQQKQLGIRKKKKQLPPHLMAFNGFPKKQIDKTVSIYQSTQKDMRQGSNSPCLSKELRVEVVRTKRSSKVNFAESEEDQGIDKEDVHSSKRRLGNGSTNKKNKQLSRNGVSTKQNESGNAKLKSENSDTMAIPGINATSIYESEAKSPALDNLIFQTTILQPNTTTQQTQENEVRSASFRGMTTNIQSQNRQNEKISIISVENKTRAKHDEEGLQSPRQNQSLQAAGVQGKNARTRGRLHSIIKGNKYKKFTTDTTNDGRKFTQSLIKAVLLQEHRLLNKFHSIEPQIGVEGNAARQHLFNTMKNTPRSVIPPNEFEQTQTGQFMLKEAKTISNGKATKSQRSSQSMENGLNSKGKVSSQLFGQKNKETLLSVESEATYQKPVRAELTISKGRNRENTEQDQTDIEISGFDGTNLVLNTANNETKVDTEMGLPTGEVPQELQLLVRRQNVKIEVPNQELKSNYIRRKAACSVPRDAIVPKYSKLLENPVVQTLQMQNHPSVYFKSEQEFIQLMRLKCAKNQIDFSNVPSDLRNQIARQFKFQCDSVSNIINNLPKMQVQQILLPHDSDISRNRNAPFTFKSNMNSPITIAPAGASGPTRMDIAPSSSTLDRERQAWTLLKSSQRRVDGDANNQASRMTNKDIEGSRILSEKTELTQIQENHTGKNSPNKAQEKECSNSQHPTNNLAFSPEMVARINEPKPAISNGIYSSLSSPESNQLLKMQHQFSNIKDQPYLVGGGPDQFSTLNTIDSNKRKDQLAPADFKLKPSVVNQKLIESRTSETQTIDEGREQGPVVTINLKRSREIKVRDERNQVAQEVAPGLHRMGVSKPSSLLTQSPFKHSRKVSKK